MNLITTDDHKTYVMKTFVCKKGTDLCGQELWAVSW